MNRQDGQMVMGFYIFKKRILTYRVMNSYNDIMNNYNDMKNYNDIMNNYNDIMNNYNDIMNNYKDNSITFLKLCCIRCM